MTYELPNVHEVISYLCRHLSMRSIDQLSGVPYTTLSTLKYKNTNGENGSCTFNTYKKLYKLYQEIKIMEEECSES